MTDRQKPESLDATASDGAQTADQPWSADGEPLTVAVPEAPVPLAAPEAPATRRVTASAKPRWAPFEAQGEVFAFDHLVDFEFSCRDSAGDEHRVLVVFTDHVFTRDPKPGDQLASGFPGCSRTPFGVLCPDRHRMSRRLPGLIEQLAGQRVWSLTGADRYGQIPVIDDEGRKFLYAVIFTLDRMKGARQTMRMLVRSAHFCDRKPPDTFGEVKFAHLVKLRHGGQHPRKIYDRNRRRPRMP